MSLVTNPMPVKFAANPWMILSVTSFGAFITTLNSSTLNVALPTLMQAFDAPVADVGWIVTCYMVTITIFVIHAGKVSDLYGRKKMYTLGVAILVISSLLAGFFNSIALVILLRVIQGIGAALMSANTIAIVVDTFPVHQRGTALGINSMAFASGAVFGPVVGGLLLEFSWRWIFWFNVPLGIILVFFAWRVLASDKLSAEVKPFDVTGTLSLLCGIVSVLGVITYGLDGGWGGWVLTGLSMASIISFYIFIQAERKASDPIVHLHVFRNKLYTISNITSFINALSRMSVPFTLIFYLQGVRGFSPLSAGLMLIPMAGMMSIMGPISGKISDRIGSKLPITVGLLLTSIGLFALGRIGEATSIVYLGLSLALIGIGSGMFQAPNTLAIMSSVPINQRGVASGTRMMMNNLGMMLSMSIAMGLIGRGLSNGRLKDSVILEGQLLDFIFAMHVIFIGGAVVSLLAMVLSTFRATDTPTEKMNIFRPDFTKDIEIKK